VFSVGCPCLYCASAGCESADCLVCRDADIFRGQFVTRIQILYSESYLYLPYFLNLLMPNVNYSGRTAPLTSKVAFYIFIQQI